MLLGRGFYCINFNADTTHHVSAPHPLYDTNTHESSALLFRGTDAKYYSLATAHRCANTSTATTCVGTTSVCSHVGSSQPFRNSDMAHTVDNYFYNFSVLVHDLHTDNMTMQSHGCGGGSCPTNQAAGDIVMRLSVGTETDLATTETVGQISLI